MQTNPLITVIVPAFNAEHTILGSLNSLFTQTLDSDIEVIVIDDGSVDKTASVVANFFEKNSLNWKLVSQRNTGEAAARNTGLKHCNGKYILFLDADDSLHINALQELIEKAEMYRSDLVFSSYRKVFSENKFYDYKFTDKKYSCVELTKQFFQRRITFGIGNTLIRTSLVKNNDLYFKHYRAGTDNHFFRELLKFVNTGVSTSDVLFYYQMSDGSIMRSTYSESRLDSIFSVIDTKNSFLKTEISSDVLASLDVFLVNEIRGNATDYLLSTHNCFSKKSWSYVKQKILVHMPQEVDKKVFFGVRRLVWSLLLLTFYYFPRSTLYGYLSLIHLRTSFENLLR